MSELTLWSLVGGRAHACQAIGSHWHVGRSPPRGCAPPDARARSDTTLCSGGCNARGPGGARPRTRHASRSPHAPIAWVRGGPPGGRPTDGPTHGVCGVTGQHRATDPFSSLAAPPRPAGGGPKRARATRLIQPCGVWARPAAAALQTGCAGRCLGVTARAAPAGVHPPPPHQGDWLRDAARPAAEALPPPLHNVPGSDRRGAGGRRAAARVHLAGELLIRPRLPGPERGGRRALFSRSPPAARPVGHGDSVRAPPRSACV